MTEPLDYSDWTSEQHIAKVAELAAKADRIGDSTIASQAAHRLSDVQQIAARAQVHGLLAELKKPAPAAPEPARQARQRTEKPAGS